MVSCKVSAGHIVSPGVCKRKITELWSVSGPDDIQLDFNSDYVELPDNDDDGDEK
jgi:hypothetical protein